MGAQEYGFVVIIEQVGDGDHFSAYVPDVPGCISTGHSFAEARETIRVALRVHLTALRREDQPAPRARTRAEYVVL